MDLSSDGTFQLLVKDPTGALVPYASPDATGTFQIVFGPVPAQSGGSFFQFEFDAQSGRQYTEWQAMVTDSPRMMLMDELGTAVFGYGCA